MNIALIVGRSLESGIKSQIAKYKLNGEIKMIKQIIVIMLVFIGVLMSGCVEKEPVGYEIVNVNNMTLYDIEQGYVPVGTNLYFNSGEYWNTIIDIEWIGESLYTSTPYYVVEDEEGKLYCLLGPDLWGGLLSDQKPKSSLTDVC